LHQHHRHPIEDDGQYPRLIANGLLQQNKMEATSFQGLCKFVGQAWLHPLGHADQDQAVLMPVNPTRVMDGLSRSQGLHHV
jgi:hypothetical protein